MPERRPRAPKSPRKKKGFTQSELKSRREALKKEPANPTSKYFGERPAKPTVKLKKGKSPEKIKKATRGKSGGGGGGGGFGGPLEFDKATGRFKRIKLWK